MKLFGRRQEMQDQMGRMQDEIMKLRRMVDMTVRVKANDRDVMVATVEELYYISEFAGKKPGEQYSLFVPEGMDYGRVQYQPADKAVFFDVTLERRQD